MPKPEQQLLRAIPKTGEEIPAVGLGTYGAFASLGDQAQQERLQEVINLFTQAGGRVLDSSPMYAGAEDALGTLVPNAPKPDAGWFYATKVWIDGGPAGLKQMSESSEKMGTEVIDLMQIHNMRDWEAHLPSLKELKQSKKIRYIGLTTWGGLDHELLLKLMKNDAIDFIQVTYNLTHRKVEERILPLAQDQGLAVIANRPFDAGGLFRAGKNKVLPEWAVKELQVTSWAQFFLKFILGDSRITSVIPATSKPRHLRDNMNGGVGPIPSKKQRKMMLQTL